MMVRKRDSTAGRRGSSGPFHVAAIKDCRRTDQKARGKRNIAKQLQMNKVEKHLLAFGFPTGGDIEKIEIGGEGHDTDLGKVQHQLPIDCARFSRWPGQQHRDCGRYPEYEKDV